MLRHLLPLRTLKALKRSRYNLETTIMSDRKKQSNDTGQSCCQMPAKACSCPQNVMKCLGVLPASKLIAFESSESDTSNDSEDLVKPLVRDQKRRMRAKRSD